MNRTVLSSAVALTLVLGGASFPATASAAPKERSKADLVSLVKKADPGTRTSGRVLADRNTVRAAGVEVTVQAAKDAIRAGDEAVMAAKGVDYVSRSVEGGFQIAAVIDDATRSTQTYRFEGKYLELVKGGYVVVRVGNRTGEPVAMIDPAWAVDANGAKVPSHYRVDGDKLIQTTSIGKNTELPVVADPRVRSAWYGLSVDFSKAETKKISSAGNSCSAFLGFATLIAGQGGVTTSVIVGALAAGCGVIGWMSDRAVETKKCISVKVFVAVPGVTAPWISKCYK